MLTRKQIYERVAAHLLNQRAVSEDASGTCRLRGIGGMRCSIGSLLADAVYQADFEGIGIGYYRGQRDGALLHALFTCGVDAYQPETLELLIELEELHDDGCVDEWPRRLVEIGARHALV